MSPKDRPLVWLHGEIKTPPFTKAARIEAGYLLRCHELRIVDELPGYLPDVLDDARFDSL